MSKKKLPKLKTYRCGEHVFVLQERYELQGIVGSGAYGTVAKALDTIANKVVAVKKIKDVFGKDETFQKRMLREILLMNHFRGHLNIVCLTDIGIPESFEKFRDLYIFMEYMDFDLRSVVRSQQRFTDGNVRFFLYQILRGMKYIHSANVLHRDIKPGNILVSSDFDVKICDFGISRGINFKNPPKMSTKYVATRWYRAPELLMMWDCNETSAMKAMDIWGIGCIFAELLDQPSPHRRVLLPGVHYLHQVDLTVQLCGTFQLSKEEEIRGCERAVKYVLGLPKCRKMDLKKRYHKAPALAIDLLEKMLAFDPKKRITVEDALAHKYLKGIHNEEDEPKAPIFGFYYEEEKKKIEEKGGKLSVKRMMYNFLVSWVKQVHGFNVRDGKIQRDRKIIEVKYVNKKKKKKERR